MNKAVPSMHQPPSADQYSCRVAESPCWQSLRPAGGDIWKRSCETRINCGKWLDRGERLSDGRRHKITMKGNGGDKVRGKEERRGWKGKKQKSGMPNQSVIKDAQIKTGVREKRQDMDSLRKTRDNDSHHWRWWSHGWLSSEDARGCSAPLCFVWLKTQCCPFTLQAGHVIENR